jgi:flagellar basal body-associated protein FliL
MNKKTIIAIAVAVVVVLVVVVVFAMGNHGSAPQGQYQPQAQSQPIQAAPNNQAQAGQPAAAPAGNYVSSDDGFSANFSGTPVVTKTQFNSLTAGYIPLTEYRVQSGSGSSTKYFAVSVYHYPQTYQFPSGYLTAAMQVFAMGVGAKYPGAKLASQTPTQLLGAPAVSGVITVPIFGKQGDVYLTITTKGQNTYGIGTYGMDQASYNAFVNSFTFTQ